MFGISPDSMRDDEKEGRPGLIAGIARGVQRRRSTRSVDITKHGNLHRRMYRNQPEKAKAFLDKFRKEKTVGERIRENADSAGYTVTEKNPDKKGPGLIGGRYTVTEKNPVEEGPGVMGGIVKGVQRYAAAKEKDERRVDVSKHGNLHRRRNRSLGNLR